MAIVKYGGGVTEFRGSIGGVTFSRNDSGTFARARVKPRFPRAYLPAIASTRLNQFSIMWATDLTDAQRIAWNTHAAAETWTNRLGETYSPTGFNLFNRANVLLTHIPFSYQDTAPALAEFTTFNVTLAYTGGVGVEMTDYDGLGVTGQHRLLVWFAEVIKGNRYTWSGPWTWLNVFTLGYYWPPPITLIPEADTTSGARYFFRMRQQHSDGRSSFAFFADQLRP